MQKELQAAKERELKSEECLASRLQVWREEKRHLLDSIQRKEHRSIMREVNAANNASEEVTKVWMIERSEYIEQINSLTGLMESLDAQVKLQKQQIQELQLEKSRHHDMLHVFGAEDLHGTTIAPATSVSEHDANYEQVRSSELLRLVEREAEALELTKKVGILENIAQKLREENEKLKEHYEIKQNAQSNLSSDTTVRMLQLSRQNELPDEVYALLCAEKQILQERCNQLKKRLEEKNESDLMFEENVGNFD